MKKPSAFWNRDEKALLAVSALVVILGVAFIQFLRHRDDLPTVAVPTPILPMPNAFDFLERASRSVKDDAKMNYAIAAMHPTPPDTPDDHPYSQSEKEALVRENAPVFATLRQGFAHPYFSPPVRSFSTFLPFYARDRDLARLLTLESQARAGRGDWAGSISSNLDALQIGVMVPHGGTLIGGLVGIACQAIGRRPIWSSYQHLSAAQSRAAAQRLGALSSQQVTFADTMQEEEWSGQAGLLEILHAPNWRHGLATSLSPGGGGTYSNPLLEARLQFTPKRRILDDYTGYMNRVIAAARRPYAVTPPPPVPGDPVSQMLLPDFNLARFKDTDNQTQNALLTTILALHACRQERGAYPATLAALVPGYLKAVPDDPFAVSSPLRYRRNRDAYLLYSIGPDGRDDGGAAVLDTSKAAPSRPGGHDPRRYTHPDSKGDIVAGVNEW